MLLYRRIRLYIATWHGHGGLRSTNCIVCDCGFQSVINMLAAKVAKIIIILCSLLAIVVQLYPMYIVDSR